MGDYWKRRGFMNQTRFAGEPTKDEIVRAKARRKNTGLCPEDGYPLRVRSINYSEAIVVCLKCHGVLTAKRGRGCKLYRLADTVLDKEQT
jgi:hypothetical protein